MSGVAPRQTVRPLTRDDGERLVELEAQAFNFGPVILAHYRSLPPESWRGLTVRGRLQAVLRVLPCGQYFGGRSLPAAGIASVAVAPEARGQGLSTRLLGETLAELREQGVVFSSLYPSVYSVYRRVGYEVAGVYARARVAVGSLPTPGAPKDVRVEPWDEGALPAVEDCYKRFARAGHGLCDRPSAWWGERVLRVHPNRLVHHYLVRRGGEVTAYCVYTQEPPEASYHTLHMRDFAYLDEAGARAIFSFLAGQRVFVKGVIWPTSPEIALSAFVTGEIQSEPHDSWLWMARLVDVRGALEARGYLEGVATEVDLHVEDALFPENEGGLRLAVDGGRGAVEASSRATARLDVSTLAALFTGWLPAREAVRLGRLTGATPTEVSRLELIFAGPRPWMMDTF